MFRFRTPSPSLPALLSLFAPTLTAAALLAPLARAALPTAAPVVGLPQALDAIDYVPAAAGYIPQVTFDGANYAVVWSMVGNSPNSYATRVSPAGAVLDGLATYLPGAAVPTQTIATPGVRSLFWSGNGPATRMMLDANNAVLSTTTLPMGPVLSASASGNRVVIGTSDGSHADAYVYDATGNLVTSSTTLLASNGNAATAAGAGSSNFLLATTETLGVFGYDLTPLGSTPIPDPSGLPIYVAAGASDFLVLYGIVDVASTTTTEALYAVRVTQTGALEDTAPIPITSSLIHYYDAIPAMAAWNGTSWQLAWVTGQELNGSLVPNQLVTGTISSAGAFAQGQTLATYDQSTTNPNSDIGFGLSGGPTGQTFITWTGGNTYDVLGMRLDENGAPIDTTPIPVSTVGRPERDTIVTRGDQGYLAVWFSEGRGGLARRFDGAGAPLDATPILASPNITENELTVVATDGEYVVSWLDQTGPLAARITDDGALLDSTPLTVPGSIVAAGDGKLLSVARGGSGGTVTLLDPSGAPLGAGTPFASGSFVIDSPAAAWNGSAFVLVWSTMTNQAVDNSYGVGMALVALDGTVTSLPNLAANEPGDGTSVGAVSLGNGNVAVTWDTKIQLVSATGALVGGPVSWPAAVTQWPWLSSDAPGRLLLSWGALGDTAATSAYGLAIDFTSSPAAIGASFALTSASFAYGLAVASDGVTGNSLVVGASAPQTASSIPMSPRGFYETLQIQLAPSGNVVDGGADASEDSGAPSTRDGGGVDAGEDDGGGVNASSDAGALLDAGGDSGATADAGAIETMDASAGDSDSDASTSNGDAGASSGCNCTTAPGRGDPGAGFALLALALVARRSRSRAVRALGTSDRRWARLCAFGRPRARARRALALAQRDPRFSGKRGAGPSGSLAPPRARDMRGSPRAPRSPRRCDPAGR